MTSPARRHQPVHTVYGGANLFVPGVCPKLGSLALRALAAHGPFPGVGEDIMEKVRSKLQSEPVEDYRIDFEDGYGERSGAEEDGHAKSSANALAVAMRDALLPLSIGLRIKPFRAEHRDRSARTLEIFLTTLLHCSGGALPANFVITIPKATGPHDVSQFVDHCEALEATHGLPEGLLKFEFLVETPQALLSLAQILDVCRGRCDAAHFGAYDYMASIDIAATEQHMRHPSCDFARNLMKAACSGRGIFLADGATNTLPVGDPDAVQLGWRTHFNDIRHSLQNGFYQSWDLHPSQLVSRYAAVYSFFREGWQDVAARLRNFKAKSAQATLTGSQFDDAATVRGLTDHLNRAVDCGAISARELESIS